MWYQRTAETEQPRLSATPVIPPSNVTNQTVLFPSTSKRKRQDFEQDLEDLEEGSEDEIHQFRRVHVVLKRILTALPMQLSMKNSPLYEYGKFTVVDAAVTDCTRLENERNIPPFQLSTPQTLQHPELHCPRPPDREIGINWIFVYGTTMAVNYPATS